MLLVLTNFNVQIYHSSNLISSIMVAVEMTLLSEEFRPTATLNSFSALESCWTTDARKVCDTDSSRLPNSVSPKQLTLILLSKSQSKAFYLPWSFPLILIDIFLLQWIPGESEMRKCANIQDTFLYSILYFFSALHESFFHQGVNR